MTENGMLASMALIPAGVFGISAIVAYHLRNHRFAVALFAISAFCFSAVVGFLAADLSRAKNRIWVQQRYSETTHALIVAVEREIGAGRADRVAEEMRRLLEEWDKAEFYALEATDKTHDAQVEAAVRRLNASVDPPRP